MERAVFYVFTGTGNTLALANKIKDELAKFDITTDIQLITKPLFSDFRQPTEYDIVGFGYPIHAFNCPKVVVEFASKLEKTSGKYAFIFKTSGEPFALNSASSYRLSKQLSKKGIDISFESHILMPYNIMFRYKDILVKQMLKNMHAMAKVLAIKISRQEVSKPKYGALYKVVAFLFRIQWGGAKLNGRLYHVNKKKCINCDLCIKSCPAANIHRDEKTQKIKFSGNCTMCMRCSMNCPANAINIGILNLWKVNKRYLFDKILNDESVSADFVNTKTPGYFKLFNLFFKKSRALYDKYDVEI